MLYFQIITTLQQKKQNRKTEKEMEAKSFIDIPNEVIEKSIMVYLSVNDLRSFGRIGIERIKQMAEDVIEKRRE